MKRGLLGGVALAAAVVGLGACGTAQQSHSNLPPANPARAAPDFEPGCRLKLIFADEFDGGSLDRSKWNVVGPEFWVNNEQQAYVDSPDTIEVRAAGTVPGAQDGVLVLQPRYRPGFKTPSGRTADFVSGRIDTRNKFQFTHGRAAARIRMPDAIGVWPAFWLLGNGKWPDDGEIDIMEYVGEKDWVGVALHGPGYSGETPLVNKHFFDARQVVTDWHVYAVEWTDRAILFKVDERIIYRATRPMVEHYGAWVFDTPKFVILNFAVGGIYPFKTNGIKAPYYGVPVATVDRIKAGEITMEVDWVRVHRAERPRRSCAYGHCGEMGNCRAMAASGTAGTAYPSGLVRWPIRSRGTSAPSSTGASLMTVRSTWARKPDRSAVSLERP